MRAVALIIAGLTALVSMAAWFGDLWWVLDNVANFRVQLGAISLAVLGLVAAMRSLPAAGIAALALLVNAAAVAPLILTPATAGRTTLTVASFNLLSTNESYDAVIEWIEETDADVVFLHEGTEAWESALRVDLGYDVVVTREPHFAFGTIALVPPGSPVINHGFARTDPRVIEVQVGRTTVFGIHPLAPESEDDALTRNEQLRWVAERARSRSGGAVVIGDFNTTPWSSAFRSYFPKERFSNAQGGNPTAATWRVDSVFQVPIDLAVFTNRLGLVSYEVGPDLGSDHRPILVAVGPRVPSP